MAISLLANNKARKRNKKMNKMLYALIAELVQELIDYGKEINDIITLLSYYGITKKQALEWYGLEEDNE
jgi:hypothetical protein